jgi:hypothetical protein
MTVVVGLPVLVPVCVRRGCASGDMTGMRHPAKRCNHRKARRGKHRQRDDCDQEPAKEHGHVGS